MQNLPTSWPGGARLPPPSSHTAIAACLRSHACRWGGGEGFIAFGSCLHTGAATLWLATQLCGPSSTGKQQWWWSLCASPLPPIPQPAHSCHCHYSLPLWSCTAGHGMAVVAAAASKPPPGPLPTECHAASHGKVVWWWLLCATPPPPPRPAEGHPAFILQPYSWEWTEVQGYGGVVVCCLGLVAPGMPSLPQPPFPSPSPAPLTSSSEG